MNSAITGLHSAETPYYLVTDAVMSGSDADIEEALAADGRAAPYGTIIHTAGFASMKMKGLDGTWVSVE